MNLRGILLKKTDFHPAVDLFVMISYSLEKPMTELDSLLVLRNLPFAGRDRPRGSQSG